MSLQSGKKEMSNMIAACEDDKELEIAPNSQPWYTFSSVTFYISILFIHTFSSDSLLSVYIDIESDAHQITCIHAAITNSQ